MGAMASQMTSLTVVYLIVHSGADQRKHQSYASLAFVWAGNSPVTGEFPAQRPVMRKMFPFDDIIMYLRHIDTCMLAVSYIRSISLLGHAFQQCTVLCLELPAFIGTRHKGVWVSKGIIFHQTYVISVRREMNRYRYIHFVWYCIYTARCNLQIIGLRQHIWMVQNQTGLDLKYNTGQWYQITLKRVLNSCCFCEMPFYVPFQCRDIRI